MDEPSPVILTYGIRSCFNQAVSHVTYLPQYPRHFVMRRAECSRYLYKSADMSSVLMQCSCCDCRNKQHSIYCQLNHSLFCSGELITVQYKNSGDKKMENMKFGIILLILFCSLTLNKVRKLFWYVMNNPGSSTVYYSREYLIITFSIFWNQYI